jgi:cellulose biosynthesis protein BcsQ
MRYIFWNNKGGTGKTSLAFQAICRFAQRNPHLRILTIDVCPQANLSELFLGGMTYQGSNWLLQLQGGVVRQSLAGYFQTRLPSPYLPPPINAATYIVTPANYNTQVPRNIDLVCGDPLLELQSAAINTLANNQIPGTNTWIGVIDWLNDFLAQTQGYDYVFFDANPSFSIYTQIALAASNRLILPVMADDSSRRAIQNAFSLIYGFALPSPIYAQHAFATRMAAAGRYLPQVHLIVKNRLTQYMGPASAFQAVLTAIDYDVTALMANSPQLFTFNNVHSGVAYIRDFQTAGVVAFARGCPFAVQAPGRIDIGGHRVRVDGQQLALAVGAIDGLVNFL